MPLLRKDADGLQPTRFGASILKNIERMQEEADTIARTQASLDSKLEGVVRLSATEGLGTQWLPAVMAEFRNAHPEVLVEMLVGFKQFNLAQREADIALRWGSPGEQNSLFARKVATPRFGLFASHDYVARKGMPKTLEDLAAHDGVYAMIDKDHPLWLGAHVDDPTPDHPPGRVTFQTDSIWAFTEAVIHGYGIGLMALVTATAQDLPLVRILPEVEEEEDLWIVAHEDLKRSPRIRAVFDYIVGAFERDARFFREGGASRYADALTWSQGGVGAAAE